MALRSSFQDNSEAQGSEAEDVLEERRASDSTAGPSGRTSVDVQIWPHKTHNAGQAVGETWDEDVFGRRGQKPIICMLQNTDDSSVYLQGYFMTWTANEAHLRIPVNVPDKTDKDNFENRYEWVNLKSSRIWRGGMSSKHWRHLSRGAWKPKLPKKKAGKKRKSAPTGDLTRAGSKYSHASLDDSEDREDTGGQLAVAGGLDSRHTAVSDSQATPNVRGQEWEFVAGEQVPEVSKLTDSEDRSRQPSGAVEQPAAQEIDGARKEEMDAAWRRFKLGHLTKLNETGQLNMPWTKGCNWESGNLAALLPASNNKQEKTGLHSQASADEERQKGSTGQADLMADLMRGSSMREKRLASPRSTSPSTPHKADRGCRQQNSSSEEGERRSALNTVSAMLDKGARKRGRVPNTVGSPRSIGNAKAHPERIPTLQNERWKKGRPDDDHEQNSGSSSSSGDAQPDVSPNTVLDGFQTEDLTAAPWKGAMTAGGASKPQTSRGGGGKQQPPAKQKLVAAEKQTRKVLQQSSSLPVKKRMKLALVETDPFDA